MNEIVSLFAVRGITPLLLFFEVAEKGWRLSSLYWVNEQCENEREIEQNISIFPNGTFIILAVAMIEIESAFEKFSKAMCFCRYGKLKRIFVFRMSLSF